MQIMMLPHKAEAKLRAHFVTKVNSYTVLPVHFLTLSSSDFTSHLPSVPHGCQILLDSSWDTYNQFSGLNSNSCSCFLHKVFFICHSMNSHSYVLNKGGMNFVQSFLKCSQYSRLATEQGHGLIVELW